MTKDQIIVGQKYKHISSNYIYLGVGKRVMGEGSFSNHESNFTHKNLIIIDGLDNLNLFLGQIVQDPVDCREGMWDGFEKID